MIVEKDILENFESERETTDRLQREQSEPRGDRNDIDFLCVNRLTCDFLAQRIIEFKGHHGRDPQKIIMTKILLDDLTFDAQSKLPLTDSVGKEGKDDDCVKTFMGITIEIGQPTFNLELK